MPDRTRDAAPAAAPTTLSAMPHLRRRGRGRPVRVAGHAAAVAAGRRSVPARSRPVVATLLFAGLLAAAGCTTTSGTPAPAPSAASDTASASGATAASDPVVAWLDQACAAGVTVATPALNRPDIAPGGDLAAVQRTLLGYLDSVLAGVRHGRTQLVAAGPAPVPNADTALTHARATLDALEQSVVQARNVVAKANPGDPVGFAAALGQVQSQLAAVKAPDALRELLAVPGLAAQADRSPACTQLRALAAKVPG